MSFQSARNKCINCNSVSIAGKQYNTDEYKQQIRASENHFKKQQQTLAREQRLEEHVRAAQHHYHTPGEAKNNKM